MLLTPADVANVAFGKPPMGKRGGAVALRVVRAVENLRWWLVRSP